MMMMMMMMMGVRLLPQKCLRLAYAATSPFCPPPLYPFVVYHSGSRIWKSASMQLVQSCTLSCTLSQQGIPLDIWSVQIWILKHVTVFCGRCRTVTMYYLFVFLILCLRLCLWSCLFVVFCVIWSEAYCRQAVQDKRCWWVSEWTGPVSGLHQHQQELLLLAAVSGTTTICISVEILFTSVSTGNPTTCSSIKKYYY